MTSGRRPAAGGVEHWWVLGLVAALAVAIRWLALRSFEGTSFAAWPQVDAWTYWDQARTIFEGKDPFQDGFYQPPGYPWLLALVFRAVGDANLTVARTLNLALGTASTVLVYLLGRSAGRSMKLPWTGPVAAALFSLHPFTILFELDILTLALTSFLFTAALSLLLLGEGPRPWRAALAGLLIGVGAMVHGTFLLLLPAVPVGLLAWGWQDRRRHALATAAAFGLGFMIGVLPTASTNLLRWNQVALVSHNAGLNLYLGNNPDWRSTAALRAGIPFRSFVLEAEPAERDLFQRNRFWLQRTLEENLSSPATFAGGLAVKALWSVNRMELPRNEDLTCRVREGPCRWIALLPARWSWVLPLAVLGALIAARRERRSWVLMAPWIALHLAMVIFLVADRYRMATWPALSIMGAVGISWLGSTHSLRAPRLGWAWLAVGLAVTLPWIPLPQAALPSPGWCLHLEGNHAFSEGRHEEAAMLYRRTLDLDPDDVDARRWLAQSLLAMDMPEEAARTLRPVADAYPNHFPVQSLMARMAYRARDLDGAIHYLERAFAVPGDRAATGARLVRLLSRAGREEEALDLVQAHPEVARKLKPEELPPQARR